MKPPPVIDGVRVLEYAVIDESVRFTGRLCLYVGEKRLGQVPRLAICKGLDNEELLLFHCDDDWNVLGAQGWNSPGDPVCSVDEVKTLAEKYYAGISSQWIAHGTSVEDARAYREKYIIGDMRCSFCDRTMYEVQTLVAAKNGARICELCITDLNERTSSNQTRP